MPLLDQVSTLVENTTSLLDTVNVTKQKLDQAVTESENFTALHEAAEHPHEQYVNEEQFASVANSIILTQNELLEIRNDLNSHESSEDPHEQYVQKVEGLEPVYATIDQNGLISNFRTRDNRTLTQGDAGAIYAPRSTGEDQTAILNELFSDASAMWSPSRGGSRVPIIFPADTYMHDGLLIKSNIACHFDKARFIKIANAQGNFTDPRSAVMKTVLQLNTVTNSHYGYADNIGLYGGIFDPNNRLLSGGLVLMNMRNSDIVGFEYLHAPNPDYIYWGTIIGGRNLTIINPKIKGGTKIGQDGLHICYGDQINVIGGDINSGDDAIALGMDSFTLLWDDEGLTNVTINGTKVNSMRASAIKIYYPGSPGPGDNRHKIKGVTIGGVTGKSGVLRNGGVAVQDESPSKDPSRIQDVKIDVDLDLGSAEHNGVNAYGVVLNSTTNVSVRGNFRFKTIAQQTRGWLRIRTSGVNSNTLTNLVPSTTYTATITVDGNAYPISVLGSNATNWGSLMNLIRDVIGTVADVELSGAHYEITSKSRGATSTVAITAGTLFTSSLFRYEAVDNIIAGASIQFGGSSSDRTIDSEISISTTQAPGFEYHIVLSNNQSLTFGPCVCNGLSAGRHFIKAGPGGTNNSLYLRGVKASGTATSQLVASSAPGRLSYVKITDCDASGLQPGGLDDFATNVASFDLSGNRGIPSIRRGSATINSGTTTIRINHGAIPTLPDATIASLPMVSVTPTSSLGTASRYWINPVSKTAFDIVVDTAPSTNITFVWSVNTSSKSS